MDQQNKKLCLPRMREKEGKIENNWSKFMNLNQQKLQKSRRKETPKE